MMGRRQKIKTGAESDLLRGWRRVLCYMSKPGVCRSIKNQLNRRERAKARKELQEINT